MSSSTSRPDKIVPRPGSTPGTGRRPRAHTQTQEQSHRAKVAELGCVLCLRLGRQQVGRTCVHHVRAGMGRGQRANDFLTIALCPDCHQGPQGVHGDKTLLKLAHCSEMDLLSDVIKKLTH